MQTTISNIFHFDGYKQIRTLTRPEDDSVLFCGKDVAEALGYKKPEKAISDHCKRAVMVNIAELGSSYPKTGGNPNMNFIPESDVYRLIMKSRLKTAEKFEHYDLMKKVDSFSQLNFQPAESEYLDDQKKPRKCYLLGKLECRVLASTESKTINVLIMIYLEQLEAIQRSGLAGAKVA
ncbi:MAG: BRO family protein [Aeromonas veronii]